MLLLLAVVAFDCLADLLLHPVLISLLWGATFGRDFAFPPKFVHGCKIGLELLIFAAAPPMGWGRPLCFCFQQLLYCCFLFTVALLRLSW